MASISVEPPTPPSERLSLESIPTVDLRLLSQSDLTALSLCSTHAFDLRRCDDVVIPKIDRSVFNESAGSRKQTYSRLRLAPRNNNNNNNNSSSKPRLTAIEPHDFERSDNTRIISLFKHLFNSTEVSSDALVSVNVEYSDALPAGHSDVAVSIPVYGGFEGEGERKRKRGRKPKSESAVSQMTLALVEEDDDNVEEFEEKVEESGEGLEEEKKEREKELMNKNGVEVNLVELAKMEDPYGPEIRRRTEGKEQPEELLGFVNELKGEWGSRRRKRKVVDANEFGDALPNGWKVLIAIKKKQGHAWLFCRRYISPTGRYFLSCKEVSSYLLSLTSPQDLQQQSSIKCIENSMIDDKVASENVVYVGSETAGPLTAHQSNGYESQAALPTVDHEKQLILLHTVKQGELGSASSLKCHKCSTPFIEKNGLLNHLVSCHKRKRRKASAPIEDDVMMKEGKYKCQFCDRIFYERSSYFGHVGIHVKQYVKSIGGSPCVAAQQKTCDPLAIDEFSANVSDKHGSVEAVADSVAGTPDILASNAPNLYQCNNDQDNVVVCPDMDVESVQIEKASSDESSCKQDTILHTSHDKVGEADKPVDVSTVKPDSCAPSEMVLSGENKDLCGDYAFFDKINAPENAATEISCSPSVTSQNAETNLLTESNEVDLGINGNSSSVKCEGVAPSNGLPTDREENPLSNTKLEDGSLENNIVECSGYGEGVKDSSNGDLMVGSARIHFDLDDVDDDGQNTVSVNDFTVISHKEDETCDPTDNKIGFLESTLADSKAERGSDTCSDASEDQRAIGSRKMGEVFKGLIKESEVESCSLEKTKVKADDFCPVRRIEDSDCSYIEHASKKVPADAAGRGTFQVEQTCSLVTSTGEFSNRLGEELKNNQVENSDGFFFNSRSSDTPLDVSAMTNNELGNISSAFSHVSSKDDKTHGNISNVLGGYGSFLDKQEEQNAKTTLSAASSNERMHEVTIDDITTVSAGTSTMQLPELDKVDNLRTNKLILDFGGITELNGRFLSTGQHETVAEGSSSFTIWDEPTCMEDNQTSVYGSARGVDQQERASEDNPLDFVGLQQPCDEGYNLNKVCMNEPRYGIQVNESGLYGRSSEAAREGISHGSTLNLAGLQQCDARYNINKPRQENFGVQQSGSGAYISGDDASRERVTYGNSLSLASVRQTCDSGYSLSKACVQQTCDTGYSLNKGCIGPLQGLSKVDAGEHSRDMDLMIGFGNRSSRPNQDVGTELMWRSTEGTILSSNLVDSAASQAQASGFFQAFDFLSDKSGNDLCTGNDKFDNVSSFEGLRSTSVEPMEFSFLTTQDSNVPLEDPKVLSYNANMDQSFGSSVWHQKGTSLPNMMGGHVISTMCVWCGNEFHQDSLTCELQAGSIGYLCPNCKARMSGQYL